MAKSVEQLSEEINALSQRYDASFAGKPRATRSVKELDEIIHGLEDLLQQPHGADSAEQNAALDVARNNIELYRAEREQIVNLQGEGPHVVEAAQLATWANFVFDEYNRHFAGQARATRDLGRMEEMVAELGAIQEDMVALLADHDMDSVRQDLQAVRSNLEMYDGELKAIRDARKTGTRDEQSGALALAANEQFRVYQDQFAGRGRPTRRPALLERVINNLDDILHDMRLLNSKGYRSEHNAKNIGIVQQNMKVYRQELQEIRKAHQSTSPEDRAGQLGGAANDVFAAYREHFAGQNRATRDLKRLTVLCDELYEIALQMRELHDEHPDNDANERNIAIVLDYLIMYNSEYKKIQEAQGTSR